jgi:two-component system cell cycle response regulator
MDELIQLIEDNEDWLIESILNYAKKFGYSKYTSTLEETWRMPVVRLSESLIQGIRRNSGVPELGPDGDPGGDPLADFGFSEARRHRERGISIATFLGLMKCYRRSYLDLLDQKSKSGKEVKNHRTFLERCFDRIEIAFCQEWAGDEKDILISDLQMKNRIVTNEKNKYLTIFESLPNPVVLADENNQFEYMNHAAALLFENSSSCGARFLYQAEEGKDVPQQNATPGTIQSCLPWLDDDLAAFAGGSDLTSSFEKVILAETGNKTYAVRFSRMQDISCKFLGTIIILEDITDKKQAEDALRQQNIQLEDSNQELERANRQIIEQQKAIIEEERLKVLLQMAGATAHELNQPLMALLGYIELMAMDRENPEKVAKYSDQIEDAGRRIAEIVRKIQTIRHDEVKRYAGETTLLNLDNPIKILSVEDNDLDFEKIKTTLGHPRQIQMERAEDIPPGFRMLKEQSFDIVFVDYALPSGNALDFMAMMEEQQIDIPVVVITGKGDEMIASQVIQHGAYDYLPKSRISKKSLARIIHNTMDKFRMKTEIKHAMEKMAELSTKDELTGLYNRRYFMEFAEREVAGTARYGQNLSLLMLDLDCFKQINDSHGHQAGDAVLKQTARVLKESIRQYDVACRYGGEEFAVIMPNTRLEDARSFCERLRKAIENAPVDYDSTEIRFTVSIGLAQFSPEIDKSTGQLIKRADEGLYAAKRQGRNQVVTVEGVGSGSKAVNA